jgi:hypothetical protein
LAKSAYGTKVSHPFAGPNVTPTELGLPQQLGRIAAAVDTNVIADAEFTHRATGAS